MARWRPDPSSPNEASAVQEALHIVKIWSAPEDADGSAVRQFYASQVQYYGRLVPIDQVMHAKLAFAARWPVRRYTVRPQLLSVHYPTPTERGVNGVLDWYAANNVTGASFRGAAQFVYGFSTGMISYESGHVLSRQ